MTKRHNMKRVGIYLSTLQIQALDKLIVKKGLKRSEHIRRAIDAYIKRSSIRKRGVPSFFKYKF